MHMFKLRLLSVFVLASLLAGFSGSHAHARGPVWIIYVDRDATGLNNGASWANAYTDLQTAFSAATRRASIWVAEGIYKPTSGTDRSIAFRPVSDTTIYGGFAGTETDISQRDLTAHITTLSGDIGTPGVATDNSYHVVNADFTFSVRMDGFTIRDGYANDAAFGSEGGGGLSYRLWGAAFLHLSNMVFRNNSAGYGGGIYTNVGIVHLNQVTFEGNKAETKGGGIHNGGGYLVLSNATFNGNSAQAGGGLYNGDIATVSNSTFYANRANNGPEMIADGAGIFNDGALTVTFSTFSHNHAVNQGAGIFNSGTELILNNSILANSTSGRDCYGSFGVSTHHNLIEDNAPSPHRCGTPLLASDPQLGALENNGGFTPTMALLRGSPAIDVGSDASCPARDQRGITRPQGEHCDLGAYEAGPLGAGTYDDTNSAWRYTGTWIAYSGKGPYNNTLHYTETEGDYAGLSFNGTQFTLIFTKYSNRGSIDVYIDGAFVETINAYASSMLWQQTYTSPIYAAGDHAIRFVHAGGGTHIDVDAISIVP